MTRSARRAAVLQAKTGALLVLALLLTAACDPGVRYYPVDGVQRSNGLWIAENEHLRLEFTAPGGTVLIQTIAPGVNAVNKTIEDLTVTEARLLLGNRTLVGNFGRSEGRQVREVVISPGSKQMLNVAFDLDVPLRDAATNRAVLSITYHVGTASSETLIIPLKRVR